MLILTTGGTIDKVYFDAASEFEVGAAVGALQSLNEGVYLAMNGRIFEAGTVRKNRDAGRFEKL